MSTAARAASRAFRRCCRVSLERRNMTCKDPTAQEFNLVCPVRLTRSIHREPHLSAKQKRTMFAARRTSANKAPQAALSSFVFTKCTQFSHNIYHLAQNEKAQVPATCEITQTAQEAPAHDCRGLETLRSLPTESCSRSIPCLGVTTGTPLCE